MTTKKDSSAMLDVAHVWQLDPDHNIPSTERAKVCALACMKMVLDFSLGYPDTRVTLDSIFATMSASDARNKEGDWQHKDQVDWLKANGLVAWRRNWLAPSQDPHYFAEKEGYNTNQLVAVSEQILAEYKQKTHTDIIKYTLRQSLLAGYPVIVSVKEGFSENTQNHQAVLCGYNGKKGTWMFVDPILENGTIEHTDEYFFKHFNQRAIFVSQ
jgi:hypothetical protein